MHMRFEWAASFSAVAAIGLFAAHASAASAVANEADGSRRAEWICETVSPVKPDFDYATEFYQQDPNAAPGTSCFMKRVVNARPVLRAVWTVSGLGVFEAYVNGMPAGAPSADRPRLMPGFTDVRKTRHSYRFDVTHLFKRGTGETNVLAAEVSSGWWRDRIARFYGKRSAFWGELMLVYDDGTSESVCTDETWFAGDASPVRYAGIFDGEDFDARRSRSWMTTGVEPSFSKASISREFIGLPIPLEGPWMRFREDITLKPVRAYAYRGAEGARDGRFGRIANVRNVDFSYPVRLAKGETLVVDFGQNCAAVPRFVFSGQKGATLTALPREMLNDGDGLQSRGCDGPGGSVYLANVRGARAAVKYTFAGCGEEQYVPCFTYFGYRYLSVSATDDVTLRSVESVPVTSIAASAEGGFLETGSAEVNRLVENIRWSMRSNYLSVPTDCPQRNERLGWTADVQVFAPAATRLADVGGFLAKWMRDMRDTQMENGSFASIAPFSEYDEDPDRFGWGDAGIIVPHVVWQRTGDIGIVRENWTAMKRHMARVSKTRHELMPGHFQFADWLSFERYAPNGMTRSERLNPPQGCRDYWNYLGACYWLYDARMMRDMAGEIGENADAAAFAKEAERALQHIRSRYLTPQGDLLPAFADMQGANVFALSHGLFPDASAAERGRAALLANIRAHGDCLQTGFLSTSFLMQALDTADATEMAYTLLLQRAFPSWLYSVDQGATTIWERWNSYTVKDGFGPVSMNSFNHYAYGSVLEWMFATMAGIRPDPDAPGYARFILAPRPDRRMGYVKARQKTPHGEIASEWRYEGDDWKWTFTIPKGTEAVVLPPGRQIAETYGPGTYSLVLQYGQKGN